ncbi:MAG TPA: class I tRNA ligase family protein [Candidatus Moranbacteria bacterium]|nr:class I tRNA ligase family protein [Candidatus Moranbacteria bacterium]
MDKYNPKEIEVKWQKFWAKNLDLCKAQDSSKQKKSFILDMFPYPSGEGLHVGHVESYTATDIYSRYLRMNGKNVLHPQGFDAFGLPAENYAIKTGIHPKKTTQKAIETFKRQINSMGFSYDWSREVNSSDQKYYKWTQWLFLLFYKNGLAYKKKAKVNWCPKCQTVLANEQVVDGKCERCESEVAQKDLEQWFFRITDFIEDRGKTSGLLSGLEKIDWPQSTKILQQNWIGKSEGTQLKMQIEDSNDFIEIYTTRIDTVFGMTYVVVAPEHEIIKKCEERIKNYEEIKKYLAETKKKTDLDRMEAKVKTGVELKGIKVINPFNGEALPLYVADYVLSQYGTGAVMAVPAHDERDFEFAKKYKLPIKAVIAFDKPDSLTSEIFSFAKKIVKFAKENNKKIIFDGGLGLDIAYGMITRSHVDVDIQVKKNEIEFWKDYFKKESFEIKKNPDERFELYVADNGKFHIDFGCYDGEKITNKLENTEFSAFTPESILKFKKTEADRLGKLRPKDVHDFSLFNLMAFVADGFLINSEKYDGLTSEQAREKLTAWLEKNKLGQKKINYKLRDWLVSRQRYWGAPIPIIYCEKCARLRQGFDGQGAWPVPEKDLPVVLPDDVDFKPTGESPLKYSKKFQNVKCPNCGGKASRESDTMDTFVCSSWYYLRYSDPKNKKEFASEKNLEKWLPVDLYVGGAEHSVLHLLYARFFTKVLHNLGYLNFDEPFLKLRHQGIILAEDGTKMSKSKGNVVNPDDVVSQFGADSLRCFEMFMGPLEDMKPWQTKGIVGIYRFLERVWKLQNKIQNPNNQNTKLDTLVHKTIKKVTEDIEAMRFNTAISSLMILANAFEKEEKISLLHYSYFLLLLSPFAPHISEELWSQLGNKKAIFNESWPKYDPKLIKDEEIEMVVQINGKVRDKIKVSADISEVEAKKIIMESEKIKNYILDKKIKKFIFVKGRLINVVI